MITFQGISKQFGSKVLFNEASATLNPKNLTGFIGPNGAGKSVLMRVLARTESVDSGNVATPGDLRIGYLPQEMEFEQGVTPMNLVLAPFAHLLAAQNTYEKLAQASSREELRKAAGELERLQAQMDQHDAWSLHSRAAGILTGLGVPGEQWDGDIHALSGGFRMRVVLAQLLLLSPDYLLLDEPTNHLDFDSLVWLERFLQRFSGGALIISHDRDFLSRTTSDTLELRGGVLTWYGGPVDRFLVWKEQDREAREKRRARLEDEIARNEAFVRRFKAKATKASAARSKEKRVERLKEELPDRDVTVEVAQFRLASAARSGVAPLTLNGVSAGYEDRTVLSNVGFSMNRGDKIAIIGPNGTGKSTFLKTCGGVLPPMAGTVQLGHNAELRYYSQHRMELLDPDATLYDTVAGFAGAPNREQVLSILGAFLFTAEDSMKKTGVLSGGEKSRLLLAGVLANPGNILLLDEPTNHLDVESVERLGDALARFEGSLIVVSHDEFFLSRFANRIIEIRTGTFRDFPGSLEDYRSYLEAGYLQSLDKPVSGEPTRPTSETVPPAKEDKQRRMEERKERKTLERRIEKLEKEIASLEERIETVRTRRDDPSNALDHQCLAGAVEELNELEARHESLMMEWEEAGERLSGFEV